MTKSSEESKQQKRMFHKREIRDEPLGGDEGVTSYINEDSCSVESLGATAAFTHMEKESWLHVLFCGYLCNET